MSINTGALNKGPRMTNLDEDEVTHEDIIRHFEATKKKWAEQEAKAKREAEIWGRQTESRFQLRYVEHLQLNRKGHQAFFKSVTRRKRDNLVDGHNTCADKTPSATYYKPKYYAFR